MGGKGEVIDRFLKSVDDDPKTKEFFERRFDEIHNKPLIFGLVEFFLIPVQELTVSIRLLVERERDCKLYSVLFTKGH